MTLLELVTMATEIDREFNNKMLYWLSRRKVPELQYLIDHCERILGSDFVEQEARLHLKTLDYEEDNG